MAFVRPDSQGLDTFYDVARIRSRYSWLGASPLNRSQPTKYNGRPVFSSMGGQSLGAGRAVGGAGGSVALDCGVCAICGNEANSVGAGMAQRESRYFPKSVSECWRARRSAA